MEDVQLPNPISGLKTQTCPFEAKTPLQERPLKSRFGLYSLEGLDLSLGSSDFTVWRAWTLQSGKAFKIRVRTLKSQRFGPYSLEGSALTV